MTVGSQVPDFSYTDFEGREHHLSDLGERYVLLDFWFAACGPCIAEIPNLKEARERYQSRGFEVLSLTNDDEEELDKARQVVADKNVDWPQAAGPRVRDLVNQRFRIRYNPNYVLLDPSRKIVSAGRESELPLQGEALRETLGKLFP